MLYASGEESVRQVALRARRLGLGSATLRLVAETRVEAILEQARRRGASVLVVDSIQTMHTELSESSPGSAVQVRESAARLVRFAKETATAVLIIGHVTKEGLIAGPRILEHMVDTVLYFESEPGSRFRVVRAVKNRFGAANEIGVFAMAERGTEGGPQPFRDLPLAAGVARARQRGHGGARGQPAAAGRAAGAGGRSAGHVGRGASPSGSSRAGSRCCWRCCTATAASRRRARTCSSTSSAACASARPRRTCRPCSPCSSSLRNRPVAHDMVCFGELGLTGEVRPVPFGEERLREAAKQGFRRALVPAANAPRKPVEGLVVQGVGRLEQALDAAF